MTLLDEPGGDGLLVVTLIALAIFSQQLFMLEQIMFRSRFAFRGAAAQFACAGLVTLAAGLGLMRFGVAGLTAAQGIAQVVALIWAVRLLPRLPRSRSDSVTFRRLAVVGFPIMLAGLAFTLLTTVDRWFVLAFLGRRRH